MRPAFSGPYHPDGQRPTYRVDLHLPGMPGPHPVAVLVPGLLRGSRKEAGIRYLGAALVDAGFAVVAYDHRTPLQGGDFASAVEDARALLRWVEARALPHELDPQRISVVGVGMGAAIAAVAADAPYRLAGFYGAYDFTRLGWVAARLLLDEPDPERRAWRSPARICRCQAPVLLLHGTRDRIAPVAHAEALLEHRRAFGLPTRLRLLPGVGHGFLAYPGLGVWDEAVGELLSFLLG